MVSFDDVLEQHVGGFGKFQKFTFFFCGTVVIFSDVFINTSVVFIAATPEHWCSNPTLNHLNLSHEESLNLSVPIIEKNGKQVYSSCLQFDQDYSNWTVSQVQDALSEPTRNLSTVKCQAGWEYDHSTYKSTLVTEWDLVCEDKLWVATSKSILLAGFLVGGLMAGYFSDRFGRRKTYVVTSILRAVFSALIPLSPNFMSFIIFRFLLGSVAIGQFTVLYILNMELVGPSWRGLICASDSYIWGGVSLLIPGVAYLLREWRHLAIVLSAPGVIQLVNLFFVPESPRWLYTQNRDEEAYTILKKMCKVNGTSLPQTIRVEIKEKETQPNFFDLCRFPRLRMRVAIFCVQWFAAVMVYYGLAYSSEDFGYGGNPYLNYFLGVLIELPSAFLCHLSQKITGRRPVLIAFDFIGGAALMAILAIPSDYAGAYYLTLAFSFTGRLCASGLFILVFLYAAELLPTRVRSLGIATASATSRVGGILAPYLMGLKDVSLFIPYMSMGGMAIISGLLLMPLPETKGRHLPETITEGENMGRHSKRDRRVPNQGFEEEPKSKQDVGLLLETTNI